MIGANQGRRMYSHVHKCTRACMCACVCVCVWRGGFITTFVKGLNILGVGVAMGYVLDGLGSLPGSSRFISSTASRLTVGSTQPPIQWVPEALFRGGVKQQGHEADHSFPCSGQVKKGGTIPPLLQMSSWYSA
jgi:hypothetical protein